MKITRIIATLLLITSVAQAQNYEKRPWMPLENRIGLALGIGSVTYLDRNSSPLIYQSRPKNLRLFYNLETNNFLFSIDFDFRIGVNGPKYIKDRTLYFQEEDYKGAQEDKKFPAGGSLIAGKVSIGGFYKIESTQESTFKVAVGGHVSNELFYPQGWNSGGIFNALIFSPEAWTQHWIDSHHSFTGSVRIPLIASVSRLPYDNTVSKPNEGIIGGFLKNSEWVGVKKFLAPAFTLGYNYQINQKWGAGLNYEFSWYSIQQPQTMRLLSQSVLANFNHQF